jgi:predicted dehydrogenase
MAAVEAGKHVYCEWPLGRNTDEAERMLAAAEGKGVIHAVGLQGQWSPTLSYIKDLVANGYVGRVLSATLIGRAPNWGATLDRGYQADFANGANLMTITGGHQIDALCYCLGEFREVSAYAVTQRSEIFAEDKGTTIPLTTPDQLAVIGLLDGGAIVSFQIRGGMARGIEFLFEIHGSEGDLVAAATTGGDAAPGTIVAWCAEQGQQASGVADRSQVPLCAGQHRLGLALQCGAALRQARRKHSQRHEGQPRLRCRGAAPPPSRCHCSGVADRSETASGVTR